ncbi:Alpha/Beta hydrolase protein [Mycena floridula]|nr:Alpha/Beta hydrolase protein [Mycena floridula]
MISRLLHLALLLSTSGYLARAADPVVDLGYAQYQGVTDSTMNITTFLGIRYAAPPVGKLRFRAPQSPLKVAGIQSASTAGDGCIQGSTNGKSNTNPFLQDLFGDRPKDEDHFPSVSRAAVSGSEDCLFLNVVSPSNVTDPLPVVVWIHGGLYMTGSSLSYTGSDLVREANYGVVTVLIQYRLGLFGFLAGEKVKAGGSLNAGLLDQDFALRWVQEHISKFGGDPARVTIWGISAGAGSVLQHVVANNGHTQPQLFRAAMTSSTFFPPQYHYNDRIPELIYSEVVTQANCNSAIDTLTCLRDLDVETLATVNLDITPLAFYGTFTFVPVVDGTFITQSPILSMALGEVNGEGLLAMTNAFEGSIFVNSENPLNATEFTRQMFPNLKAQETAAAQPLYQALGTDLDQDVAIHGEAIFICASYFLLDAFKGRSFKGEYAVPPGGHSQDQAYYFPTLGTPVFNNPDFIKAFSHAFLSFAMSLDPNIKVEPTITPTWAKWTFDEEMLFNKTTDDQPLIVARNTDPALLERCR